MSHDTVSELQNLADAVDSLTLNLPTAIESDSNPERSFWEHTFSNVISSRWSIDAKFAAGVADTACEEWRKRWAR